MLVWKNTRRVQSRNMLILSFWRTHSGQASELGQYQNREWGLVPRDWKEMQLILVGTS